MDQRGPRPQRARPWQRPSLFSIPGQRNPWATRTQKQPRGSRSSGGRGRGAGPRGATASHWRALRSLRHVTEPARPSCPRPQSWCAAPGARIPRPPDTCGSSPASQSPPATSVTPPIFFFQSPNRLAGKLRVASQPSGSSSPLTYRCCHPPQGPPFSKTWGLEVGSDWPALKSQHHSSYCETTVRSRLLSIFLPQNVHCYPHNHMV